jgi:hypothetical protein
MSAITWGVVVYSPLEKRYFLPDFSIIAENVFSKGAEDCWFCIQPKYTQKM